MNCEQASEHLLDFIDGTLHGEARDLVEEHVASCAACRRDVESARETWRMLGDLAETPVTEALRERFFGMLHAQGRIRQPSQSGRGAWAWLVMLRPGRPVFQAAAAAGLLLLGVALGSRMAPDPHEEEVVRVLRAEMESMQRAIVFSLLENRSASERLRAVSLTQETRLDDRVTDALLQVITTDPSVNVRLAALDVLSRTAGRPDVQERLIEAFPVQSSPTMTVAMADVLMALDGPRSRAAIQNAVSEKELPDEVKAYLQDALREEH